MSEDNRLIGETHLEAAHRLYYGPQSIDVPAVLGHLLVHLEQPFAPPEAAPERATREEWTCARCGQKYNKWDWDRCRNCDTKRVQPSAVQGEERTAGVCEQRGWHHPNELTVEVYFDQENPRIRSRCRDCTRVLFWMLMHAGEPAKVEDHIAAAGKKVEAPSSSPAATAQRGEAGFTGASNACHASLGESSWCTLPTGHAGAHGLNVGTGVLYAADPLPAQTEPGERWEMQGYEQRIDARLTEARVRLLSKNGTHVVVDGLTQDQAARIMDKHNDTQPPSPAPECAHDWDRSMPLAYRNKCDILLKCRSCADRQWFTLTPSLPTEGEGP